MTVLRLLSIAALALLTFAGTAPAPAAEPAGVTADKPDDANALAGVSSGKVVWDISMSDPENLAVHLSVVRETYDDLVRQDIEPDMVLAIHGRPVTYLQEDLSSLALEDLPQVEKVNAILDELNLLPGVRIEVCSVANRLMGVDNAAIRDGFHVVGNTWVSLIGYQAKGHAMIPIH